MYDIGEPDHNVVNRVINGAFDASDYERMQLDTAVANADRITVAQQIKRSIVATMEDVKHEDGTICPPEDRVGWEYLVY